MTIKEVCERYELSADTLRYYERVGVIPPVARTKGGVRNYTQQDILWVENAVCMRNAGLSVETLAEYVRLFQEGDGTIPARRALLAEAWEEIAAQLKRYQETLDRLDVKISRYDEAMKTGVLIWNAPMDDDAATIVMVDSNIQRESLLPSERAFAYRMKLEAMKRQGMRTDLPLGI